MRKRDRSVFEKRERLTDRQRQTRKRGRGRAWGREIDPNRETEMVCASERSKMIN